MCRDESGVMVGVTVVVFLLMAVGVFMPVAVGYSTRQRIQLQNTADAAAYSGTLVQADGISRVAALNQAMSWHYAQLGKMTREYILDKWLTKVYSEWSADRQSMQNFAQRPMYCKGNRWYAGKASWQNQEININGSWESASSVKSALNSVPSDRGYEQLGPEIDKLASQIDSLGATAESIIKALPGHIERTVQSVCSRNSSSDTQYALQYCPNLLDDCFDMLTSENDESDFLAYSGESDAEKVFGSGTNNWFVFDQSSAANDGLGRKYEEGTCLKASWNYGAQYWKWVYHWTKYGGYWSCDYQGQTTGSGSVTGETVRDSRFITVKAKSYRLTEDFFWERGGVAVAVATPKANPLDALGGRFFSFFASDPGYAWTVSAARPGYNVGTDAGTYATVWNHAAVPTLEDWKYINLGSPDWDAVIIPLSHMKSGSSGKDILLNFWNSGDWRDMAGDSAESINIAGGQDVSEEPWH